MRAAMRECIAADLALILGASAGAQSRGDSRRASES